MQWDWINFSSVVGVNTMENGSQIETLAKEIYFVVVKTMAKEVL